MAYITNADLEERLGSAAYVQLADDNGDGTADVGVVDEARLAAEGEVDSYLAARFAVPIDVVAHPDLAGLLASIALDLAEVRLRVRRPPVPDAPLRRRAEALDWLTRVATGALELPASGVTPSAIRGVVAATTGDARVLSREELADF